MMLIQDKGKDEKSHLMNKYLRMKAEGERSEKVRKAHQKEIKK